MRQGWLIAAVTLQIEMSMLTRGQVTLANDVEEDEMSMVFKTVETDSKSTPLRFAHDSTAGNLFLRLVSRICRSQPRLCTPLVIFSRRFLHHISQS